VTRTTAGSQSRSSASGRSTRSSNSAATLDCIRADPSRADCRGILAGADDQAAGGSALAESRGIDCAEVDLAVLRGEREPDLTLFAL